MAEASDITLTEHQRYWLKHIRACESSDKRITEYAARHGLSVRAMYDSKRALVKKGVLPRTHATRFQRARVVDPVAGSEWCIQLRLYYLLRKCIYMLFTFCVDNAVDELFLTAPGSLCACAHIRLIKC